MAACPLILWNDNDLIAGADFIADSAAVMQGGRDPGDCATVASLYSGRRSQACSGGASLVRREFLLRYGGFIEGFVRWGGEDNAWNRKVALLGRSATTLRRDQRAYHLFHPSSAGYRGHAVPAGSTRTAW